MTKIDWRILAIVFGLFSLCLLVGIFGCSPMRAVLGLSPSPIGDSTILPTSPASQMWKVVAKSNWIVTVCLLAFGGGLFTFFNGKPKLGLAIVFSSLGTLFIGLAIHRFPTWMAVVGLLGSVAGVTASILMRHRAIIEMIKGGQVFKDLVKKRDLGGTSLSKEQAEAVKQGFNIDQQLVQSPTTQKLVKKIKNDLKLKGEI